MQVGVFAWVDTLQNRDQMLGPFLLFDGRLSCRYREIFLALLSKTWLPLSLSSFLSFFLQHLFPSRIEPKQESNKGSKNKAARVCAHCIIRIERRPGGCACSLLFFPLSLVSRVSLLTLSPSCMCCGAPFPVCFFLPSPQTLSHTHIHTHTHTLLLTHSQHTTHTRLTRQTYRTNKQKMGGNGRVQNEVCE